MATQKDPTPPKNENAAKPAEPKPVAKTEAEPVAPEVEDWRDRVMGAPTSRPEPPRDAA